MNCICNGKTVVLDVRHDNVNGITYRLRKCKECGDEFFTKEEYQFDSEDFMKLWNGIGRRHK